MNSMNELREIIYYLPVNLQDFKLHLLYNNLSYEDENNIISDC